MSLLEEAAAEQSTRRLTGGRDACAMALEIEHLFDDVNEVAELLAAKEIQAAVKYDVLAKHGLSTSVSTFKNKMKNGCRCAWCRRMWVVST